jgi:hypothetical protein
MDPSEENLFSIEPDTSLLAEYVGTFEDSFSLVVQTRHYLATSERYRTNYLQLERIVGYLSSIDGNGHVNTILDGASVAYAVMCRLIGDDADSVLYRALGAFESACIHGAGKEIANRQKAVGFEASRLMEKSLAFETVSSAEGVLLYDIIEDLGLDEESQLDMMTGYRLVYGSIAWAEQRRADTLRTIMIRNGIMRPRSSVIRTEESDQSTLSPQEQAIFNDIDNRYMAERDITDGYDECTDDFTLLLDRHSGNLHAMAETGALHTKDESIIEDIRANLSHIISSQDMRHTKNLSFQDSVIIKGNTVVTIIGVDDDTPSYLLYGDNSRLSGRLLYPDVDSSPTNKAVKRAINLGPKFDGWYKKRDLDPYSLVLVMSDLMVTTADGVEITFDSEVTTFVTVYPDDFRVWRDRMDSIE